MSYQVDSYGNAYFPAGVSVASIPVTTGTQAKVLVPGVNGKISSATVAQLITQSGGNLISSVFGRTGVVTAQQGDYNTDQITEGEAQYFSTSRVRKSIFLTTFNTSGPATYDSGTGILNIPQYVSDSGSGTGGSYVPLTRTISINGQTADLSVDRAFSIDTIPYPSTGIPLSNGTSWGASIVNNSANWNTAYGWGDHAGLYSLLNHIHTIANVTGLQIALDSKEPTITAGTNLQYWRGDKSWQTLPIYANFTRTIPGLVPNPGAATTNRYLREDGTWVIPPDNDTIYVHPTTAGNKHIPAGGVAGEILRWSADGTAVWGADNDTTYVVFTRSANGLTPAAPAGTGTTKYLREDGTWQVPPDTDTDTNTWDANTKTVAGYVAAPGAVANKVWKTDAVGNPAWRDDADTTYTLAGLGGLPLAGGIMTGAITLKEGAANGLKFPNDVFGGSGDTAGMRLITRAGESMSLEVYLTNDADDWFNISVPNDSAAKVNGNTIWHAANLTNLNQLTNGPGYITSYSETDTLGSVTNRGNSTSQNLVFSNGRKGLIGVYDAAQTQAIFAMGAAYILTDGGASSNIGNLYGLAWSYNPDYGGAGNNPQSKAGLNHQLLHMQNGVTTTAIGTGIWTVGNVTAASFIGSIAWTSVTGRPTALSSFTNDLGNYGSWYSTSGGTVSGDVTINGVSNIPLTINQVQPFVHINATGATNTAGIRIYPSAGYDAYVGNFNGGALNLVASGVTVAKVTSNAGVIFYTSSTGPITSVGSNTSASMVFINGDSSNKTWDISMYANDWILNESNITTRFKVLAGGGVYADAYYEFSDKRFKTLIEENPNIINVGSITAKSYIKEGKEELGYFAQDFEGVLDSAILKDKDGVLSLSYRQIHTAKIAALEKRIAELEAKLK